MLRDPGQAKAFDDRVIRAGRALNVRGSALVWTRHQF